MTKTSLQRRVWRNFIQRGLVAPIFIHSRSLLFEGNVSLKCVLSGLTPHIRVSSHITTVSGCYRELNAGLLVPIFIHILRDFPVLLFAFLLYKNGCGLQPYTIGLFSSCV